MKYKNLLLRLYAVSGLVKKFAWKLLKSMAYLVEIIWGKLIELAELIDCWLAGSVCYLRAGVKKIPLLVRLFLKALREWCDKWGMTIQVSGILLPLLISLIHTLFSFF